MTPPRTVPAEPTEEMLAAIRPNWMSDAKQIKAWDVEYSRIFKTMCAAAPPPPEDRLLAEAVKAIEELLRSSRRFTKATDPFLESRGADEELDARRDVVAVRAATEVFLERLRAAQQPTEEGGG